jgi:hypothetical protein
MDADRSSGESAPSPTVTAIFCGYCHSTPNTILPTCRERLGRPLLLAGSVKLYMPGLEMVL